MKRFEYKNPKNLKEAGQLLGKTRSGAMLYAGGTDVLDLVKNGIESVVTFVNLKAIRGLHRVEYRQGYGLTIGACALISDIAGHPVISKKYAVLAQAAGSVASPQLRNMGTLGGNICQRPRCWYFRGDFNCLRKGGDTCYAVDGKNKQHCIIGGGPCYIVHPSDIAVALTVLDARLTVLSGKKSRDVSIREFFVLPEEDELRENILKHGEIITKVFVPEPSPDTLSGYLKFSERAVWDFAVASVGMVIQKDGQVNAAFGGVAPIPWMDDDLNVQLSDSLNREQAIMNALSNAEPLEENGYKLSLARSLLSQLFNKLLS